MPGPGCRRARSRVALLVLRRHRLIEQFLVEALGMDWHTRTERIEEQMKVLKMLWSQPLAGFRI